MQETGYKRTYVRINVDILPDGTKEPLLLYWNDAAYEIVNPRKIGRRAAQSAGGVGILYTVMVEGKERRLYNEIIKDVDRWFVEEKLS